MYNTIILAAGRGNRMNSDLPKVLAPLGKTTMIQKLLSNLDLPCKPVVVVGYQAQSIKDVLGDSVVYATQTHQLGTGDAVMAGRDTLCEGDNLPIIILYGDQPLISQATIDLLIESHHKHSGPLTIASVGIKDFKEWRLGFKEYGRIIRDTKGRVVKIVEYKDASSDERRVLEVNPAIFVCDPDWLWDSLAKIKNNNAQGEYYLTDLIQIAFNDKHEIKAVPIDPRQGLGANTPEQLETLKQFI